MRGLITKMQRFSVHDGPGIRTTIFLKGCPLSCSWCHNPETISEQREVILLSAKCVQCEKCIVGCAKGCFSLAAGLQFDDRSCDQCGQCVDICPTAALQWSAVELSVDDVMKEVSKDQSFYEHSGGGLTLSGGEPLSQIDFCLELAGRAKQAGWHVALDTSGHVPWPDLQKAISNVDLFLFDLKFIDDDLHEKYTGASNTLILENFRQLSATQRDIIVRTPMVPGITDGQDNLSAIASFVNNCRRGIRIEHIPFNALAAQKYSMLGRSN